MIESQCFHFKLEGLYHSIPTKEQLFGEDGDYLLAFNEAQGNIRWIDLVRYADDLEDKPVYYNGFNCEESFGIRLTIE